jgi:hypothetical protein
MLNEEAYFFLFPSVLSISRNSIWDLFLPVKIVYIFRRVLKFAKSDY